MTMCHWVDPGSLRSYRRLSHAEQAEALEKASAVPVRLLQPRNAPVVSEDVHYAAFMQELAVENDTCADKPARPNSSPSAARPPAPRENTYPDEDNATNLTCVRKGDHVLVAKEVWPDYTCEEHEGRGWEAKIINILQELSTRALPARARGRWNALRK